MSRFMAIKNVISNKSLNRSGVLKILKGIWSVEVTLCIKKVGNNLYGFSFKSQGHLKRAIEEGP
ncbi:hypothetical protein DITRI_Ditri18aG0040100 [Diplodiscus trichospermus]